MAVHRDSQPTGAQKSMSSAIFCWLKYSLTKFSFNFWKILIWSNFGRTTNNWSFAQKTWHFLETKVPKNQEIAQDFWNIFFRNLGPIWFANMHTVGKYQHFLHGSGLLGSEKQWLWEKLNFIPKKKRNERQSRRKSKVTGYHSSFPSRNDFLIKVLSQYRRCR
jgi:hypothetical protein